MAHPLRLRLLELLTVDGPLTATEASERVGESPANCSFHLRTLAKYGFAEEAPGGTGRQRPWRATPDGTEIHEEDLGPEALHASRALTRALRRLEADALEAWNDAKRGYPMEWRTAAFERHNVLVLTAAELDQLGKQVEALFAPYEARLHDPAQRPDGAVPVTMLASGFPSQPAVEP